MKNSNSITVITPKRKWFHLGLKEVVEYKDLILLFVRRNFTAKFKQTLLGPLWAIIQPLLTTVVFTIIFGNIAGLPTDGVPKFLFYMCSNVVWGYFASCLTGTANIFTANSSLLGKVYFPRIVMPVTAVLGNLINFAIQFFIFLCFWLGYIFKGSLEPNYALIPLCLLLIVEMAMLGLGFGMIVSALTTKYRDLAMLVSFCVQLWLYASPVAYSSSLVKVHMPKLYTFFMCNPMAPVIETFRYAFLGNGDLNIISLLVSIAVTVVVLFIGLLLFNRVEKIFMDTV